MAYTPDDIYKIFITKRTQVEMIGDRGYLVPEDEIAMFLEHPNALQPTPELFMEFVQRYIPEGGKTFAREEMSHTYKDENDKSIYVYFAPQIIKDKQGVSVVSTFIENLTEVGADVGIIITNEGFTPDAKKLLDALTKPIIQVFYDFQLYANPTYHNLVPKHTKLSEDQRRILLTKYKIQPRQITGMSMEDPITRYYGWLPNDLIKIDRINISTTKTMIRSSTAYRIVTRMKFDQEKKKAPKAKVTH